MKALLATIALAIASPAIAQSNCFIESEIKPAITDEGFKQIYRAQSSKSYFFEVYQNNEKFVVLATIDGISCILDQGYRLGSDA